MGKQLRRLGVCIALGIGLALVLLGLPASAQQSSVGVFFLFDRSGSMSHAGIDSQLRHGSETAALLAPSDSAGGGFFGAAYHGLAPLGDPIQASQAFTDAQGTAPLGATNLLEGLNQAEAELGSFPGVRAIIIYGDGCAASSESVEARLGDLIGAGYLIAYVQVEQGCGYLADNIDPYYPPSLLPTPDELIRVIRPEPVGIAGAEWHVPRGELINIKWNLPITVSWSNGSHSTLTALQKENEVDWSGIQPAPGDGSTLLAFLSPNDTGSPLTYTIPFTWGGFAGEHTVVVSGGGRYHHLEVLFPTLVQVGQAFTFTVSIVDQWGNAPAVLPPSDQDTLYRLGGSTTSVRPETWVWQPGSGSSQTFSATAGQEGCESIEFVLEGGLRGWSNTFEAVATYAGPNRVFLPAVARN